MAAVANCGAAPVAPTATSKHSHSRIEAIRELVARNNDMLSKLRHRLKKEREASGLNAVQRRRAFFTSAAEERETVEKMYKPGSIPMSVMDFVQDGRVQMIMTMLLVLDVIIVIAELIIDAEFPKCTIIERNAASCCPYGNDAGRSLAASYGDLCDAGLSVAYDNGVACDPYKFEALHTLHDVLFWTSVSILCVFEVELLSLMAVLRKHFLRNRLYLIDFTVVTAALGLEMFLRFSTQSLADVAGVLTFARLWRFVRLGHGLVSSLHERHASHVEELASHVEALATQVTTLQGRLEQLEHEALVNAGGKACKKFGKRRVSLLGRPLGRVVEGPIPPPLKV
jgi:hypothetical protein